MTLDISPMIPSRLPSVEDRVEASTEIWARDLRSLFEHAKERFGDVTWESEGQEERIWAHKGVVYARAPKAFKERYFTSQSFSRSGAAASFRSPSPFAASGSPVPSLASRVAGAGSSLSVTSGYSDNTVRGADGILRLGHGDTPELFRAQLEWLYTGEGFGDVVEWISAEDEGDGLAGGGAGGSIRDSLGRRGNIHERRDKLGQDLTYMWRSKLYADVRIHLTPDSDDGISNGNGGGGDGNESDSSTDSLSATAIFTSHRFILASRSPYFASLLLNPSSFRPHTADIHLSTPPFTPAALHFCLGYIYAGHLDFSNRTFDLTTAFHIHRSATYLQIETLSDEVESRLVWDFCHGMEWDKCHCRKCIVRVSRVWRFAIEPAVGAVALAARARSFILRGWGECTGREIGTLDEAEKGRLQEDTIRTITPSTVVKAFRSIESIKKRMEAGLRAKGKDAAAWVDGLEPFVDGTLAHSRRILIEQFAVIAEGQELWSLVNGKGFDGDLLETLVTEIVNGVGTLRGCIEAPRVYQALVSSILLKVDPNTLEAALAAQSRSRQEVERAREGVLAHIKRRWMHIRDSNGFLGLRTWALKEISDEIEIEVKELINPSSGSAPFARSHLPGKMTRTSSRIMSLSDAGSVRSGVSESSRASRPIRTSTASRTSTLRDEAVVQAEPNGLRRLRLSSSASTNSLTSTRSAAPATQIHAPLSVPLPTANGSTVPQPSARSPTASRQSSKITIGAGAGAGSSRARTRPVSPTPTVRTTREMSGGLKPLTTGATAAASVASTRSLVDQGPTAGPSTSKLPTTSSNASTPPLSRKSSTNNISARGPRKLSFPNSIPKSSSSSSISGTSKTPMIPPVPRVPANATSKVPVPAILKSPRKGNFTPRTTLPPKSPAPSTVTLRVRQASAPDKAPPVPGGRAVSAGILARGSAFRQESATGRPGVQPSTIKKTTTSGVPSKPHSPTPSTASAARSRTVSAASTVASKNAASVKNDLPGSRLRSTSVSTTASTRSKASTTSKAGTANRLVVPTEPVPTRSRTTSTATTATTRSTAPQTRGPSTTTLRTTPGSTPKSVRSPPPTSSTTSRPTPRLPSVLASSARLQSVSAGATAPRPLGPVLQAFGQKTTRSPSGSTDDAPEARTPQLSQILAPLQEPLIVSEHDDIPARSVSGGGGHFPPATPIVILPRATRKASQASTRSTSSAMTNRPHPASAFDPPKRVEYAAPSALQMKTDPLLGGKGVALGVGIPCIVSLEARRARFKAVIKYIGLVAGCRGPWVGIETDDLDRFGVPTLPSGSKDGILYFHFSPPAPEIDPSYGLTRQRRIEQIRETLPVAVAAAYPFPSMIATPRAIGLGIGLGVPSTGSGRGYKRSISPFVGDGMTQVFDSPRALFVRPSEVIFVEGAE